MFANRLLPKGGHATCSRFPEWIQCDLSRIWSNRKVGTRMQALKGGSCVCVCSLAMHESGKTYTLFGAEKEPFGSLRTEMGVRDSWGIVPRACHEIFQALGIRHSSCCLDFETKIAVSYVEIFGDSVIDLLDEGKPCGQNGVSSQRFVLKGSAERGVSSLADLLALLNEGEAQKRKAATAMNDRSSRAHAVFIVKLDQTCLNTKVAVINRLFFADLGGSEQIKKSQPHSNDSNNRREREQEAININLGLLALKQCVEALQKKRRHVPFSDSKLTMIISEGLGRHAKTAVLVCGAQEECHGQETISTMKFGQVCRGIRQSAAVNTSIIEDLLRTINREIAKCEEKIRRQERWEIVKVEEKNESGQVVAVRQKTLITGAEELREQLGELISKKMELTGDVIVSNFCASGDLAS